MEEKSPPLILIAGAFAAIYVIWGTTYLASYFAIQSIPVFLMCGSRFVTAGTLLLLAGLIFQPGRPTLRNVAHATWAGFLFLVIGTGGVVWAEQYVDTGLTALIISTQPLIVALMLIGINRQRPPWSSFFGIGLGMLGMGLLVTQGEVFSQASDWWGIASIGIAILAWAYASVIIKKLDLPKAQMQNSGLQMLCAGIILILISLISGEASGFSFSELTQKSFLSWLFLIVFGSWIGFLSYNFLLQHISPERVSTNTYVNPVVAMLLGWALNNEKLTRTSILAAVLMLTGVFIINMRKYFKKRAQRATALKSQLSD